MRTSITTSHDASLQPRSSSVGSTRLNWAGSPRNSAPQTRSLCASGAAIHDPTTEFFVIDLPVGIAVGALTKAAVSAISGRFTTAPTSALANSGPIPQSLGAASRAEGLARKLNLNINSPTTRQVLNSLDTDVSSFVSQYRKGSIWRELPGEVADMTVAEAIQHSSTARKLLTSNRFAK